MAKKISKAERHMRRVCKKLSAGAKLGFPVSVDVGKLKGRILGRCEACMLGGEPGFRISLRAGLTELEREQVMIHEWAHALDMVRIIVDGKRGARLEHGDEWAQCYGVAWRAVYEASEEGKEQ